MRTRIAVFVSVVESILLLTHLFIYGTWIRFWRPLPWPAVRELRIAMALLSISFVAASFTAFRVNNLPARWFYTAAAVWLGFLNFFFVAAVLCWAAWPILALAGAQSAQPALAFTLFGLAVLAGIYGLVNAARPRVSRASIKLPGLPDSWRGRVAAVLSDTHLGHVRGRRFAARLAARLQSLRPDMVFFPGDLFDGTRVDPVAMAEPWKALTPPLGFYFVTGNHEEFFDPGKYLSALTGAGIRVLRNETVVVDGLQIVGVNYRDSTDPGHYGRILDAAAIDRARPSVLLVHVPAHLEVPEQRGVSLQLSGHTHGGQVFPFSLFVRRIFGRFAHGLQRFGNLAVYTSYGAGTWGPPMRVGTWPEIVLIRFE